MSDVLYYLTTAIVFTAGLMDILTRRIPNLLTVSAALLGLALHGWLNGWDGLSTSLLGFLIGFFLLLPGYLLNMTGAGDLKLMAAVGSLVGSGLILKVFILFALASLVMALVIMLYDWTAGRTANPLARILNIINDLFRRTHPSPSADLKSPSHRLPLAPAIAVGVITAPFFAF